MENRSIDFKDLVTCAGPNRQESSMWMVALGFAIFPRTSLPTQLLVLLIFASRTLTVQSAQINGGQSCEGEAERIWKSLFTVFADQTLRGYPCLLKTMEVPIEAEKPKCSGFRPQILVSIPALSLHHWAPAWSWWFFPSLSCCQLLDFEFQPCAQFRRFQPWLCIGSLGSSYQTPVVQPHPRVLCSSCGPGDAKLQPGLRNGA